MYCRKCGYVLDGLDKNRCPECGREFDPNNQATYKVTPLRFDIRCILGRVAIVALAALLAYAVSYFALVRTFPHPGM